MTLSRPSFNQEERKYASCVFVLVGENSADVHLWIEFAIPAETNAIAADGYVLVGETKYQSIKALPSRPDSVEVLRSGIAVEDVQFRAEEVSHYVAGRQGSSFDSRNIGGEERRIVERQIFVEGIRLFEYLFDRLFGTMTVCAACSRTGLITASD